jgi:hypothetical protein
VVLLQRGSLRVLMGVRLPLLALTACKFGEFYAFISPSPILVLRIRLRLFDGELVPFAGDVHDCLNVRYPDRLLMLEIFKNTTQRRGTIGRSNHKGMDADRYD